MKFSKWIERRLSEALNPELDRLKRDEKLLLMSIQGRVDSMGMVTGINKKGYEDAMRDLKSLKEKIKAIESKGEEADKISPIPDWIKNNRAV